MSGRFFLVAVLSLFAGAEVLAETSGGQSHDAVQQSQHTDQQQKRTLVVGSEQDYPPFATGMTDDEAGGFTVELWKAVAAEEGLDYTIRVRPFHQILEEFKQGKIDVLINLAHSEARHQFADFTVPHVIVHGAIFVRKGESAISSEDDFAGKSIIVLKADLAHDYAISKGWEKQLVLVDTSADGFRLLASGKHDAMLLSELAGMQTLQQLGLTSIKPLKVSAGFSQSFAFAVRKGDAALLYRLNEGMALVKVKASYDELYDRWFSPYEIRPVSWRDLMKYLIPVALAFLAIAGYLFYRRQVERQEAEAKYRDLYDHSPDMLLSVAAKTEIIIDCNQTLLEATGYSRDEVVGHPVFVIYHPDAAKQAQAAFQKFLSTKEINDVELQLRRKDGGKLDVSLSATAMCDRHGVILHSRSSLRDITLRRQIEQALAESESRFREIFNTVNDAIFIHDAETGAILDVNRSMCKMYGFTHEEALRGSAGDFSEGRPPFSAAEAYEKFRLVRTQGVQTFEWRARARDGHLFWVEVSLQLALIGNKQRVLAVVRDISQRKETEAGLRIAATVFESQEGVIVTDADNRILRVNSTFSRITGYSADEVTGQNPRLLKSGRQDAGFYAAMWESITRTSTWSGEIWNRRKNGEIYPEYLTISAVKDQQGNISNFVGTFNDISANKAAADEIENLAFYDFLTGLPNRRLLIDRFKHALATSARSGKGGALLFIDLDNFKNLNDTLGHDMGDFLLQLVAERLSSCVREGDTVARFGGDEFVVMLEDLSEAADDAASQTEAIGEKILADLKHPYQLGPHEYFITSSIGVVLFDRHERVAEDLLKQADIAMYQSKKAGRNTLRFFDPMMQASIDARAKLEGKIRLALAEGQFKLYYQAQSSHDFRIVGAEVLIRWQSPELGLVPPDVFIPLAEETGLILPIGQWVLEMACTQLKLWQDNPLACDLQLAVNVSARQFHQPDFVERVLEVLDRTDVKSSRIKLELTESAVLDDIDDAIQKMIALREAGVSFSMDDFGTGYSSLSYLTRLPLDQLKIDRSFVQNIGVKPSDSVIVQTIIGMARNLGMEVVAEGVETEAQRDFLDQSGCHIYQGYLFSKPVPLVEFEKLLMPGHLIR